VENQQLRSRRRPLRSRRAWIYKLVTSGALALSATGAFSTEDASARIQSHFGYGGIDDITEFPPGDIAPWPIPQHDIIIWNEKQDVRLASNKRADFGFPFRSDQTYDNSNDFSSFDVEEGRIVDSHFIHANLANNNGQDRQGCIRFDTRVYAVLAMTGQIDNTEVLSDDRQTFNTFANSFWPGFDSPTLDYRTNGDVERGLEFDTNNDFVTVPASGNEVCVHFHVFQSEDEVRVLTDGSAPQLNLSGPTPANVGSQSCVTATFTRNGGAAAAGEIVPFSVAAGPNAGTTGTATNANGQPIAGNLGRTNSSGSTSFCYTGGVAGPPPDTITAFLDDGDGVQEGARSSQSSPGETMSGEPTASTTKTWKAGRIDVVKSALPSGDAQVFTFTPGGGLSPPGSFQLDDNPNSGTSNTKTFSNVPPGGGYSVSESPEAHWDLLDARCVNQQTGQTSSPSSISVGADEQVICTFTNQKRGTIVVNKTVNTVNSNPPQDFHFTTTGFSPGGFDLDADETNGMPPPSLTFVDIVPGSGYGLSEAPVTGWDLTGATCSGETSTTSITVSPGETVNCTFMNRERGKIVVQKFVNTVNPDPAQDFHFTTTGLDTPSFDLDADATNPMPRDDKTFDNLLPGSGYGVDEPLQDVPTGWDRTGATCTGEASTTSITVSPGETVTCTFTNRQRGKIKIKKVVSSVHTEDQDFDFTTGGGLSPAAFQLDDDNDTDATLSDERLFDNVVPGGGTISGGAYSVREQLPNDGWWQVQFQGFTCEETVVNSLTLAPTATIRVEPGETVTCTFRNIKFGTLILEKQISPGPDPDPYPPSFFFQGLPCGQQQYYDYEFDRYSWQSWLGGGESQTCERVLGSWHVTEYDPGPAYALGSVVCDDGNSPTPSTFDPFARRAHFKIDPGETVRCVFRNDDQRGRIVWDKEVAPGGYPEDYDPQRTLFNFYTSGFFCTDFSSYYGGVLGHGQTATCPLLLPGQHTVSESDDRPNFEVTDVSCDDGNSTIDLENRTATVNLEPREVVHCHFVNDDQRGEISWDKQMAPGGYPDAYDPHATRFSFATGFNCSHDFAGYFFYGTDLGHNQGVTCDRLSPGSSYPVTEGDRAPDFPLDNITCDDDGSPTPSAIDPIARSATFNLDPHERIHCRFTNRDDRGKIILRKEVADGGNDDAYTKQFVFRGRGTYPGGNPYFYCSGATDYFYDPDIYYHDTASLSDGQSVACDELTPGSYTIQESDYGPDFEVTGITCDDGNSTGNVAERRVTFNVEPQETVTCTLTNDDQRGGITFDKTVAPGGNADAYTKQFGFHGRGTYPDGNPYFLCSGATYSTYFFDPAYYTYDSASLSDGQSVSCDELPPGSYGIQESDYGPDFALTNITCDDGQPGTPSTVDVGSRLATFNVGSHEHVSCHFVNRDDRPSLTVVKRVVNDNGGTKTASDFTLHVTQGGTDVSGSPQAGSAAGTDYVLAPGEYSVAEDAAPSGYSRTSSGDCNVTLAYGDHKTCTITNDDIQPRLTVIKSVHNIHGGSLGPSDFTMHVAGTNVTPSSFAGNSSGTQVTLDAGDFNVSERGPGDDIDQAGYNPAYAGACYGTLAVGDVKTCTVTNNDGYVRPAAGANYRTPLTIAYQQCTGANINRYHAGPINKRSCNPTRPLSGYLTTGTTDANGKNPSFGGFVKLAVCNSGTISPPSICSTPPGMSAPDLRIEASLTDVRKKDLSDYTGNLLVTGTVQITDYSNAPSGGGYTHSGTSVQGTALPIPIKVPCTATTTGDIGSTCTLLTRASAVSPGYVVGGKRSVWGLGSIEVWDGGPDGSVDTTAGNTLYARQGIFVP
jgi:hypothetical protein